jgi:hypothetical protein
MRLEGEASTHIIAALKLHETINMVFKQEGQVSMPGVPDIYVEDKEKGAFWIEVKLVKEYPKRETSKVLKHEFDNKQVNFFKRTSTNSFAIIADIAENKKLEFRIVKKEEIKNNFTLKEFKEFRIWGGEKFW